MLQNFEMPLMSLVLKFARPVINERLWDWLSNVAIARFAETSGGLQNDAVQTRTPVLYSIYSYLCTHTCLYIEGFPCTN